MPWTLRPDKTPANWLEKLNEWRDKAHVQLDWDTPQDSNSYKYYAIPKIDGAQMNDCVGTGNSIKEAQNQAAEKLSKLGKLRRP